MRLVVYEDFEVGKIYHFLFNNFAIEDPFTIAELYRERWQIELVFKWIKQHLHIKTFLTLTMRHPTRVHFVQVRPTMA